MNKEKQPVFIIHETTFYTYRESELIGLKCDVNPVQRNTLLVMLSTYMFNDQKKGLLTIFGSTILKTSLAKLAKDRITIELPFTPLFLGKVRLR